MEKFLVSAATGALQPVLGKLATLAGDEYRRLKEIRDDIKSLSRELAAMDAFLQKMSEAEEEPDDPQDKVWMNEVRELSYEAEDSIDDFMARVDARPDGFMGKIRGFVGRTKARHGIAKKIEELKKQIDEVGKTNARYRSGEPAASVSNKSKVDRRALAIFEDAAKLVGIDGPKDEVIQLLADDGEPTQQQKPIKLVAVVGSGGLGKTTLANRVYQELKGGFDCHAFVSVSQNPDIVRVMSNIFSQLNKAYSAPAKEDLTQLITKIQDFLTHENKRYFVVIDDIWKVETWDVIKCAFLTTGSGSTIITTTRKMVVAESCCCPPFSGHIYNMRPLDKVHSRQLFYGRLFNSEEKCPSHLEGISSQILDKCAGLPLAIIAISGLLADKASKKDTWERVKDSIGRALRNASVDVMVNIISLSYLDLPHHLKTCLLYLSIFPEDHTIDKENLIRRWIGEGFIHKQECYTLEESGEICFNELINRSLIQSAELDEMYEVKSCRVHDTVLDFIVSKAVEENFVTIVGVPGVKPDPRNKVRRLSLQNDGEIPAGLVISSARSFHVFGRNAKIPSISESRLLRVLDYEDCSQLEDDHLAGIGNLLHLKYLRFKNTRALRKLPEQLARLPHLEIDILFPSELMEIPAAIRQLKWLATYNPHTTIPVEFTAMQGLEVLYGLNVHARSTEFLVGLRKLKKLRKLSTTFFMVGEEEDVEDAGGLSLAEVKRAKMASSIAELSKAGLESLFIIVHSVTNRFFECDYWFPESDPPFPYSLRELNLYFSGTRRVPTWMARLVNLEKLRIKMMLGIGEEDLQILGGLPSLRHLIIVGPGWWGKDDKPKYEAAIKRAMEAHPNRPTFNITHVYDSIILPENACMHG